MCSLITVRVYTLYIIICFVSEWVRLWKVKGGQEVLYAHKRESSHVQSGPADLAICLPRKYYQDFQSLKYRIWYKYKRVSTTVHTGKVQLGHVLFIVTFNISFGGICPQWTPVAIQGKWWLSWKAILDNNTSTILTLLKGGCALWKLTTTITNSKAQHTGVKANCFQIHTTC